MIDASPFSLLKVATSFARQLWFKESRIQSWLDAFSRHGHLYRAIRYAPASMMRDRKYRAQFGFEFITSTETLESQKILDEVKVRYENTLVVELDIAAREEFKLIEHGLERLWELEKEAVVSSESSEEVDSARQKASMLSYDLNKTPDKNEYPYSGMSPDKKNAWHLAM
ncbi:hypothetical protein Ahy_B09g099160 [Arachis hypogaea]|uniref:Oxo-4-hydroxy-4-carboxy-5-ureidoimidazoline decarboxylase domain-containing protein n=1 Tax=Arachis hypogaea TaxID=3818 RepID=A0A444XT26_ARAHY|nr:hypothetical protein Ahy_B09g099160 [Arachis hypogaea]